MTLEEFHNNLDQLAALPPDWDNSYKGTSGMVVSKAAIAHARTVGAALLAAGHTDFGAFPHWEDTQPDYLVALEAHEWQVTVDPDGALVAIVWLQDTPWEWIEVGVHYVEQQFPAGATDALLDFVRKKLLPKEKLWDIEQVRATNCTSTGHSCAPTSSATGVAGCSEQQSGG